MLWTVGLVLKQPYRISRCQSRYIPVRSESTNKVCSDILGGVGDRMKIEERIEE